MRVKTMRFIIPKSCNTFGAMAWFLYLIGTLTGCRAGVFRLGQAEMINRDIIEPSGLVFHVERGSLFVVGDEGALAEISLDGDLIQSRSMPGRDLEGITYSPATGLLYAIVEGENVILEITADSLAVQRTFPINADFQGMKVLQSGNKGIEAVTFVPDRHHKEGGLFYLTNKGVGQGAAGSGTVLEIETPLLSSRAGNGTALITNYFTLEGHFDLAGMVYDDQSDSFFIISDTLNELLKVTRAGEVHSIFSLPGEAQEGIAFDHEGYLYIAQDSGAIVKFATHGTR